MPARLAVQPPNTSTSAAAPSSAMAVRGRTGRMRTLAFLSGGRRLELSAVHLVRGDRAVLVAPLLEDLRVLPIVDHRQERGLDRVAQAGVRLVDADPLDRHVERQP